MTKKTLVDKIWMRLLRIEFKSDSKQNLNLWKVLFKKYYPIMSKAVQFYFI